MLALLSLFPVSISAVELDELVRLAQSGTPELALNLIDREQPAQASDPDRWWSWERQRVDLLRQLGRWHDLHDRINDYPEVNADGLSEWIVGVRVEALIGVQRPREARLLLRDQLWRRVDLPAETMAYWRRLLIKAYLGEERARDAYTALLRYRQDYGDEHTEYRVLFAQTLMSIGRSEAAGELLVGEASYQAQVLRLQLEANNETSSRSDLLARANSLLAGSELPADLRPQLLLLVSKLNHQLGKYDAWVAALEQVVALSDSNRAAPVDPQLLWQAYVDYGLRLGNAAQLLQGEDEAWYDLAREQFEPRPLQARALFALLAVAGQEPRIRELAHMQLVVSLRNAQIDQNLLPALYSVEERFPDAAAIPTPVRHRLVELALAAGDLAGASRLLREAVTPPVGRDRTSWQLLRARVLILGGEPDVGAAVLHELAADRGSWPTEILDRFMQVVFDLQAVEHHQLALEIFQRVLVEEQDRARIRELRFWIADSWKALARHLEAAHWYMLSATTNDPLAMDPWAQTARFNAAGEMVVAGLFSDAERLYKALERGATESSQRAAIRRELRRLNIRRNQAAESRSNQPSAVATPEMSKLEIPVSQIVEPEIVETNLAAPQAVDPAEGAPTAAPPSTEILDIEIRDTGNQNEGSENGESRIKASPTAEQVGAPNSAPLPTAIINSDGASLAQPASESEIPVTPARQSAQ